MSIVDPNRIVEDKAVNRVTALLQEQGHIVHKIDGDNDFGEDLYISFIENWRTTGDTIAVQVKGGASYRSGRGYRVKVKQHRLSWLRTNVPAVCIVYDPDTDMLHWANASEQLRRAKAKGKEVHSITISRTDTLDKASVQLFTQHMRAYISERAALRNALSNLSGHMFDTTDYVAYFMNEFGEEIVFRQRRSEDIATLLHSDLDWKPVEITPDALTLGDQFVQTGLKKVSQLPDYFSDPKISEIAQKFGDMDLPSLMDKIPTVGDQYQIIVNQQELAWLRVCAETSSWWRSAPA